ncbi:transposase [Candidatus Woesearchaeota archaeon]|nr:transposase [Candidatus Woesearchaeota archaeon]
MILFFIYLNQENIKKFLQGAIFSNKPKAGKYLKICPKCGSAKVQIDFSNPVVWAYGTTTKYRCKSCGHLGSVFLEVLEKEAGHYKKELKNQIKEGKLSPKKEEMIDTSTGFSIGLFEVILGVIAFLLIPLSIFIEGEIESASIYLLIYFLMISYLVFRVYKRRKDKIQKPKSF